MENKLARSMTNMSKPTMLVVQTSRQLVQLIKFQEVHTTNKEKFSHDNAKSVSFKLLPDNVLCLKRREDASGQKP